MDSPWTFHPDEAPVGPSPPPAPPPRPTRRHEGHRLSWVPRVALVAVACAVVVGVLAVAGVGPFKAAPAGSPQTPADVVGTWNVLVAYQLSFSSERMTIAHEDPTTGAFSGEVTSPVGEQRVTGTVVGSTVSFVFRLGQGAETGSATLATVGGQLRLTGTFVNSSGRSGGISAVRISG